MVVSLPTPQEIIKEAAPEAPRLPPRTWGGLRQDKLYAVGLRP